MSGLAVVTGASSGMGECTASELLKRGWTVVAIDRVSPTLKQTEDRLRCVSADVTDRSGLQAALDAALRPGESIALVANVAGVYPPSTLSDYTEALYRHVFDVNVLGVLNVISAAVPHMEAGSSIVNFASVDAFAVSPGQLLYGASKAAVVMLTKELALELAPRGIRVNARGAGLGRHARQSSHRPHAGRGRVDPAGPCRRSGRDREVGHNSCQRGCRFHDWRNSGPVRRRCSPLACQTTV